MSDRIFRQENSESEHKETQASACRLWGCIETIRRQAAPERNFVGEQNCVIPNLFRNLMTDFFCRLSVFKPCGLIGGNLPISSAIELKLGFKCHALRWSGDNLPISSAIGLNFV